MANEPHSPANSSAGVSFVGGAAFPFSGNGLFNSLTGDTDLAGDVNELLQGKALIGRILDQIIEARSQIDDLSHLVAREPPLLALHVHDRKCTGRERSVPGQIDTNIVRADEHNGTVPITQMRRPSLVPGDTRPIHRSGLRCANVPLHRGNLGESSNDDV
jgi:hypothetical protein